MLMERRSRTDLTSDRRRRIKNYEKDKRGYERQRKRHLELLATMNPKPETRAYWEREIQRLEFKIFQCDYWIDKLKHHRRR